jgi:dihydroorotase
VANDAILITGVRIIDPAQDVDITGDILVRDGVIESCGPSASADGATVIRGDGLVATPGFIDIHTHLREPGFEDKETIATGTAAAARGGFTTLCCMPNTNPPIDSASVVAFIKRQASEAGPIHVYPIGTVTRGRAGKELADMAELAQAGAVGFSDDGAPVADGHLMQAALAYAADLGLPVIDHCEDPGLSRDGAIHDGWVASRLGLPGSPAAAEETMIARDIALAELTGGHAHIAHLTTAAGAELVRQAKARGIHVTAEVTPHHLTMSEEWLMGIHDPAGAGAPLGTDAYDTRAKVNPPLRTASDPALLAEALRDGVIDAIATDHAPHTVLDKSVPMEEAAFGISVLETAFGSLIGLVHEGLLDLPTLVHRLTVGPAAILGERYAEYATLKVGTPADIVLFDPEATWTVDTREFVSKGTNTPLDGVTLKGRVVLTMAGGQIAYDGITTTEAAK